MIPHETHAARPDSVQGSASWDPRWTPFAREQFEAILDLVPPESVGFLRDRIARGLIDGGWTWGENANCGCVLGTLARSLEGAEIGAIYARSNQFRRLTRTDSLEALVFDMQIGDTPDSNVTARLLLDWIDAWEASR